MTVKRINPRARSSAVVIHNQTAYLAGQVGNPGESVAAQTRTILASIDRLLEEAGTGKSNLLQATIWLADIGDFEEMNAVWDAWVAPGNAPARATAQARLARPDYKVEIVAVAALP